MGTYAAIASQMGILVLTVGGLKTQISLVSRYILPFAHVCFQPSRHPAPRTSGGWSHILTIRPRERDSASYRRGFSKPNRQRFREVYKGSQQDSRELDRLAMAPRPGMRKMATTSTAAPHSRVKGGVARVVCWRYHDTYLAAGLVGPTWWTVIDGRSS